MKKLLQINTVANQGSTGRIVEQIGRLAIQRGWESYIAYGRGTPKSVSNLIRVGNIFDVQFHAIQTRLLDNHGRASVRATERLIKTIDHVSPDIIHLHNIHGYYLNYGVLFNYLAVINRPVIWTLHDCWAFTGHCVFFDYPLCDKWTSHCEACPSKRTYPSSFFLDQSKKTFELKRFYFHLPSNLTLVPVSEWLDALLKNSFLRDFPSQVIHNGVDTTVFQPSEPDSNSKGKFNILSVANNWSEPRKGLRDLIELRKRLSDDYSITIVGLNEKEKRYLPDGIIGITRTSNQIELSRLYSKADVFVLPTYEDNYPNVIIEALASGTPVIVYNTGGCSEALTEKVGVTVRKGDLAAMVHSIESMRNKPLSKIHCREWALDQLEEGRCYESYFELYDKVLIHAD